jgi:hypothetical protein
MTVLGTEQYEIAWAPRSMHSTPACPTTYIPSTHIHTCTCTHTHTHTHTPQSPCSKALYYGPTAFMFTGWSLTFSLLEFSVSSPLLGTVRMANALVTGLLIGAGISCMCAWMRGSMGICILCVVWCVVCAFMHSS